MSYKDIDIKSYLESLGASFEYKENKHRACCIFHQEKTPSLYIREGSNRFECFGCGARGDVIDATKLYFGIDDFKQAKAKLEDSLHGGKITKPSSTYRIASEQQLKEQQEAKRVKVANRLATLRRNNKPLTKEARDYLEGRGLLTIIDKINSKEIIAPLSVGYNEFKGEKKVIYHFLGKEFIIEKVINPQEGRPKARNTGERALVTPLTPYKDNNRIYIVEGIEDCLTVLALGYNAISLNGVTNTKQLLEILGDKARAWASDKIFIPLTDLDRAGEEAKEQLLEGLKSLGLKRALDKGLVNKMREANCKDINDYYKTLIKANKEAYN